MPPKKDTSTGLPARYLPASLSPEDRQKQLQSIRQKKDRPIVQSFRSTKSKWSKLASQYFGHPPSIQEIADELIKQGASKDVKQGLEQILDKGRGAYYSSGSRPNQTAESWAVARLYAVVFGGTRARRVDKHIIDRFNIGILRMRGAGSNIVLKKDFPDSYSQQSVNVVEKLSFPPPATPPEVMGSMSIRSQLYASDFDLYQVVDYPDLESIVDNFKAIIKGLLNTPNIYIGDIKAGNILEFMVVDENAYIKDGKIFDYDAEDSRKRLNDLFDKGVVDKDTLDLGLKILVPEPTTIQLREIIKNLRPNVIRWKPREVLAGSKDVKGLGKFTLNEAFRTPTLVKVDVIAYIHDIFQEFSIIYDLRIGGRRINSFPMNPVEAIQRDIEYYSSTKNWFKALKRVFSLANYKFQTFKDADVKRKQLNIIEKVNDILTSDIGILYQVAGDIDAMAYIVENHSRADRSRIRQELDGFKDRLSNVYSVNEYLRKEGSILRSISDLIRRRRTKPLIEGLDGLKDTLQSILDKETFARIKSSGLLSVIKKND